MRSPPVHQKKILRCLDAVHGGYEYSSRLYAIFSQKKTRTHDLKDDIEKEAPSGPCSFIVKKGRVGKALSELVCDLRQLMSPHTFSNLKV